MSLAAPPPPVTTALGDNDGVKRVKSRLRLISMTMVTILVTVWLCTLGWVPGILGVVVAKHVLVAILVMGLGVDKREKVEC